MLFECQRKMVLYRLNTLNEGGVSFYVFHSLFKALCTVKDNNCEHYSQIKFWFDDDTVGIYRLCHEPVFLDCQKMGRNEKHDAIMTCKSRKGQYIHMFNDETENVRVQKNNVSYKSNAAEVSENWVFHVRGSCYRLEKYSKGLTKQEAFGVRPQYSVEVSSNNVEHAIDLFGRYSDGIKDDLQVEIEYSK